MTFFPNALRNFNRDERGGVAIIMGLAFIPAILLAGGAIDVANAIRAREKLQSVADSAALAASTLPQEATASERHDYALQVFNTNSANSPIAGLTPTITVEGTLVSVQGNVDVPTAFLKLVNVPSISVNANSSAANTVTRTTISGSPICLLALDPGSADGIHIQGDNNVQYTDCWAHTNSALPTAINALGERARAQGLGHCAVGGYDDAHGDFLPTPRPSCSPVNDPFAHGSAYSSANPYELKFAAPAIPTECRSNDLVLKKGSYTLEPGRYCGGMNLMAQATITLNPGIYVIDNGLFNIQSGATVTGTNVMFYFVGPNARMTLIGGGTVNLKGRTAGQSYEGFLAIAHPDAWRGNASNIQGGGTFNLEGVVYMPTQRIEVSGNGDVNGNTLNFGMIAKDFDFRGNGIFKLRTRSTSSTLPDIMPRMQEIRTSGSISLR